MNKKLIIIIPVHKYDEDVQKYLTKALNSVKEQTDLENVVTVIVCPNGVDDSIKENVTGFGTDYMMIVNNTKTDYQSQVNVGLMHSESEYFSVLEYDDELSKTYVKNVNQYINTYPEVDIFLSLMIEKNEKDEGIKFTNETVWAQQFVGENGEIGFLSSESLKQYTDFKLSGAVIKRNKFLEVGGYKTNIKLSFMYEFLLRALENNTKIMTIPKIIYSHLATRKDSLFGEYSVNMSMQERKFWFDTASKEYNFKNDRIIDIPTFLKKDE